MNVLLKNAVMNKIHVKSIVIIFILGISFSSRSQIISTFAGGGHSGLGDGGPSTAAELYVPWGIAIDPSGNIYIADENNNRVREVSNSISTGINKHQNISNEVTVYPSPTSGSFTVSGITQGQIFVVYNCLGQKIETRNVASMQTTIHIDISNQPNGIYLLRIQNKDGSIVAEKKVLKTE